MKKILEAGFSGIADTTWDAGVSMMSGRSNVGGLCDAMKHKSKSTAGRATFPVDQSNGKRCCIGPTTHAGSDLCVTQTVSLRCTIAYLF